MGQKSQRDAAGFWKSCRACVCHVDLSSKIISQMKYYSPTKLLFGTASDQGVLAQNITT